MESYSISQVARRTGFPASTLRFYEQSGLVQPARTASGYRSYDDRDVELLEFIGRAKGFGLSLEEITDLLGLLHDDRCAPVQTRLQELVAAKIAEAEVHIEELSMFIDELRSVASSLALHTPDGPCDATCGCRSDAPEWEPIACTLEPTQVTSRLDEWRALVDGATVRPTGSGMQVVFEPGTDPAPITSLAAAERDCCSFLSFAIHIDARTVRLDIKAPADARPMIDELLGIDR